MTKRYPLLLQNGSLHLSAFLHLPQIPGPYPVVIVVHGYGGNKVGYRRRFVHLAESLGKVGIATLRLDLRGCGDSEGRFSELTLEGLVSDVKLAKAYCTSRPDISRIGLLGTSLGGSIAIKGAEGISSLALWSAGADGALWRKEWKGSQEALDAHYRCGEDGIPKQLTEECLTLKSHLDVAALDLPLFAAHGTKDDVVSPAHLELYREARKGRQGDFFRVFPNSNHNFSGDEERFQLIAETADWFKKTLL